MKKAPTTVTKDQLESFIGKMVNEGPDYAIQEYCPEDVHLTSLRDVIKNAYTSFYKRVKEMAALTGLDKDEELMETLEDLGLDDLE